MIRNYIKIAFRNLIKNKTYSLINILGLSIGIACSIMVLLYLKNELTYDSMHVHKKEIYRVGFHLSMPQGYEQSAVITAAVAPSLLEEFPELDLMCRLRYPVNGFFNYQGVNFNAEDVTFADSTFFDIFSFKLLSGSKQSVLTDPYSVVLTKSLAKKIFGEMDPIGKVINWNNAYQVIVKGIAEDCPQNSSIKFNALISFTTLYDQPRSYLGWNGGNQYYNYIKLKSNSTIETVIPKLPDFLEKHINYMYRPHGWLIDLVFDRMDRMHLHGIVTNEMSSGDLKKMRIIGLIGLFVLLIAVFNFMNLTTARSAKRSVEIGIRKVLGAYRSKITGQFLGEAVIFSLFSFVISLILIEIFQPQFKNFIGDYELYTISNIPFIAGIVLFTIIIGVFAGSYPALFVARFKPVQTLKGNSLSQSGKPYLRNILVITQFVISTAIIAYTLVMILQLLFVQKRDLGFDSSDTVIIDMPSNKAINAYPTLKSELELLADVRNVGSSSQLIGQSITQNGYLPEGVSSPKLYHFLAVDENLLEMLRLEIVEGRNFSSAYALDDSAYIINEAMAKELNWQEPIGKKIGRDGINHVIGLVKDFHFENMQNKIAPLIIGLTKPLEHEMVYVKLNSKNYHQALDGIEAVWKKILPNEPFSYGFYDLRLKDNYTDLRKSIRIMGIFAVMAIIIACMGLYGLAMFTVEKRQREIGVRKVFGAETSQIGRLVVFDFLKWIVIANLISVPITYYYSLKFLETFAYTIKLDLMPFVLTLFLSLLISLFTILVQILKLSRINPVETLKYE